MSIFQRLQSAAQAFATPVAAAAEIPMDADRIEPTVGESAAAFGETQSVSDDGGWIIRAIGGGKTHAGVPVSEYSARNLPIVSACVNRITNPLSSFPLRMYRTNDDGNPVPLTPKEHPLAAKLNLRPNPGMSSRTVRKVTQGHALLWGNGYLEVERNGRGSGVGLYPLLPDRTRPIRENGDHFYRTTINGKTKELPAEDVIHIMDQSQDGYVGLSQIAMHRQAIGWGFAMEEFGSKFFANDAKSGGFLMHPGKLGPKAKTNLHNVDGGKADPSSPASAVERQGGLENAHRIKILEEGMKWISTTIPPEDAQFLGSREFQVAEMARIWDIPLILLQSQEKQTSFGSGIEQLRIAFIGSTIQPWVTAWEQELNWKLFTPEELEKGYYCKFIMNAMLRGDMKARSEFYKSLFSVGGFSPNQILALEEMDSIGPSGDYHFVPANFTTLERAIEGPPATDNPPADDDDDDTATEPTENEDAA